MPGTVLRVSFTETGPLEPRPGSCRLRGINPLRSNRTNLSPNESYPQHIVTAVIVAHDGAAWLPQMADAVLGQTRPVQRVVAVDTGSRDRSGAVLASKFGQPAVFGMDRSTGYGAAIGRALHHRAANTQVPRPVGGGASGHAGMGGQGGQGSYASGQSGDRIEWLWLLHDDCEPAADALEQLLRGTVETSTAAVLGPKLRDWTNRDVIQEAGLTLDTATRRLTGIEPREVDQGQHDGDRDALAVSSAGMLVRRDVWEQVGGFDPAMGLFMDDIDFCWRVHAAGYRVRVITDAIVYHVQAATKHRRSISVGRRARMLDRRNGLLTLLGEPAVPAYGDRGRRERTRVAAADHVLPARQAPRRGDGRDDGADVGALPSVQADKDAQRQGARPSRRVQPGARGRAVGPVGQAAARVHDVGDVEVAARHGRSASRDR